MYSEAKNFKMNDFVTRFCKFKFPRDKKHIWKYYKIIVNVNLHWMWLTRISCFIFRLNKNLFIKFTLSGMMRSKSYKSAFGRTMHVSCILYICIYTFPCRAQRYSCSHGLSVSFLPAVALSVLRVSVNCCILLTGSDYCDSCRVQLAWRFRVRQCISLNVIREPSYSQWFRGFAFVIERGWSASLSELTDLFRL